LAVWTDLPALAFKPALAYFFNALI